MRIQVPDNVIEWDDYFGAWAHTSSIQCDSMPPDEIEIIHPDGAKWNIIAYLDRAVENGDGSVSKWLYDITMKDGSGHIFTLMNE